MTELKELVTALLKSNGVTVPQGRKKLFDQFLQNEQNKPIVEEIVQNGARLMAKWKIEERIRDVMDSTLRIPNATVGKQYEAPFEIEQTSLKGITQFNWKGLEEVGLAYNTEEKKIKGTPTKSGEIKLLFQFRVEGQEEDAALNEKEVTLTINPDPKSLWKNIESDKADPYWKEENVTLFAPLGDRHLLLSSKRGRSHANVGSFREDDFAFKDLANDWSIVVVSDGAGSAKLSRKGSAIACNSVIEFFSEPSAVESMKEFDELLHQYQKERNEEAQKALNLFVYNNLGKAVFTVHKKLEAFAAEAGVALKDLSATLAFTLFKKYEDGYAILSFGVGDCPMAVLSKDLKEVTLLNWIDVGEYSGGTRFITMPEIFKNEKFASRFGCKYMQDFAYLILMSDGIYDPKFVVEAALPNIKKWQELLDDLAGNNADKSVVVLDANNPDIEEQFSQWMDFWSPGNHDDRTLAIVF